MTTSDFDKRVLIEQVRSIEAEHALADDAQGVAADLPAHSDFDERLWQRARQLVERNDLQSIVGRAAIQSRRVNGIALLVVAVSGALATSYALTADHAINIYWLLLVLLGFNLLSMLLWLVGISLHMEGLISGVLAKLTSWLPAQLKTNGSVGSRADRAWLACNFGGKVGKWQLSKIAHQLWLVYMLAGLLVLVLVLMTRQYDFVWGTTLLSDTAFVKLTKALSTPLQALGLTTPTPQQVQETRIGALQVLTAAHRYAWAQFLLGALLCFGIVPRLLLWCWSVLMRGLARRRFALDHYLPYYIALRQQLLPLAGHGRIIDADTSPPAADAAPRSEPVPHQLPTEAQWVSVELGDAIAWPPQSVDPGSDLGQVVDRDSLTRILQRLQHGAVPVLAVAVAAARSPDRGVQRTIADLIANSAQAWLVLLHSREHAAISTTRLAAWYRLAEACKVPADHVISMSVA